jgi:hypothetical protein
MITVLILSAWFTVATVFVAVGFVNFDEVGL